MADSEPLQKGHTRSVSAGGMAMISPAPSRPSALRKGHQRAFSHGQVNTLLTILNLLQICINIMSLYKHLCLDHLRRSGLRQGT